MRNSKHHECKKNPIYPGLPSSLPLLFVLFFVWKVKKMSIEVRRLSLSREKLQQLRFDSDTIKYWSSHRCEVEKINKCNVSNLFYTTCNCFSSCYIYPQTKKSMKHGRIQGPSLWSTGSLLRQYQNIQTNNVKRTDLDFLGIII